MRVGVNTLFMIPGEVGGSQTYLLETLRGLATAYPNLELVLFTHLGNDRYLRDRLSCHPQIAYVCLHFNAANRYARIIREQIELPLKIRRHALNGLWSPGYTAPIVCPVPQVVSILDMQYKRFPDDLTPLARAVTDALVRRATRRATRLLTLSEFSKSEIMHFTAASAERLDVTPLAAHPVFTKTPDEDVNAAVLGRLLPDCAPFLLCVANTYPHKNMATLVNAFGRLSPSRPHRLVLIGKPRRGEDAVRQAIAQLPEPTRVTRLDAVSLHDLAVLYHTCAAFVFPSLYEGFGLPILEAMSAGAPVVTADIPPALEIGSPWIWTCDARDPNALAKTISRALDEPDDQRQQRIDGGRQRATAFSWTATARHIYAAFEKAFG